MNDFVILHLSDLHIDSNNGNYSRVLHKLIDDIQTQVEQLCLKDKTMVLCVTGDILHKGNSNSYDAAFNFFRDLKNVTGDKISKIYMVPGNHDHIRLPQNVFLINSYRTLQNNQLSYKNLLENQNAYKDFDDVFYNSIWSNHIDSYRKNGGSGYLELYGDVHKLFEDNTTPEYLSDTFGVDIITVNDVNYCFVMLNTSWSCIDDNDTRNIFLGKFQLDKIKRQFHMCIKDKVDSKELRKRDDLITVVMGHHPVGSLNSLEEDTLFSDMVSFEEFDANIYLCGHTHERNIINWSNNRHSIDTYVTGLGWPEKSTTESVKTHTYSMYVFNTDLNSIDIKVRSTNDRGEFDTDTRFNSGSKIRPINSAKTQSHIQLSTVEEKNKKYLYWSEELLNYTKKYLKGMALFSYELERYIDDDKMSLLTILDIGNGNVREKQDFRQYLFGQPELVSLNSIKNILRKIQNEVYFNFYGFLHSICFILRKFLINEMMEEGCIVRVHFRYLDYTGKKLNYRKLCQEVYIKNGDGTVNDELEYSLSTLKYTDLIKASYENNKSLVYSLNEYNCNKKLDSKWKNFITIVPRFPRNTIYLKADGYEPLGYPLLTFGITCNNDDINKLFYCMDMFDFKRVLELHINEYINIYKINLISFGKYVRKGNIL